MRLFCSGLLSLLIFGLSLVFLGGLSGCDSKPEDGTVVQDSRTINKDDEDKVESRYLQKEKNALKKKTAKQKR